jgi:hypothetical protein
MSNTQTYESRNRTPFLYVLHVNFFGAYGSLPMLGIGGACGLGWGCLN